MSIKLPPNRVDEIAAEYQAGRSIEDIRVDTGLSLQMIKRALAEKGLMQLSWHKTKEEEKMLSYLHSKEIKTLFALQEYLA